jgi:hypothetical protein
VRAHIVAVTALLSVALGPALPALAQQPQYQQPQPGYREGRYRIHDVHWVGGHIGTAVLTMEKRRYHENGGHEAAALDALRAARDELRAADGFAEQHGYQQVDLGQERLAPPSGPEPARGSMQRMTYAVQRHTQAWLDMLERDNRDFGGHRQNAIGLLQRAQGELTAALQQGQ